MLDYQPNMVLSEKEYDIVGKRPIRPDGADKVTGIATYSADINLPGMLHGKVVRPPVVGAKVVSIDETSVSGLPGTSRAAGDTVGAFAIAMPSPSGSGSPARAGTSPYRGPQELQARR